MSRASDPLPMAVIVDTSVLIRLKRLLPIAEQWEFLEAMGRLVGSGRLAYPRQVVKELAEGQHPDAPGAWITSKKLKVRHSQPQDATLARVLAVAPVVDVEATDDREVADPYILAMAVEIQERHPGLWAAVATEDVVDRLPAKLSLATGCERLGVARWTAEEFVEWVRASVSESESDDPTLI